MTGRGHVAGDRPETGNRASGAGPRRPGVGEAFWPRPATRSPDRA